MAFLHVLLDGTGTSGDGSTWDDASDGTSAFIGGVGFDVAITGAADGDVVYVKGTDTLTNAVSPTGNETLASYSNPIQVIGVKTGTTNLGGSIVVGDLIPGIRTGETTPAHAWGGGTVPKITCSSATNDIIFAGAVNYYGMAFESNDDINIGGALNVVSVFEECEFIVGATGDKIVFNRFSTKINEVKCINCRLSTPTDGLIQLVGFGILDFIDCEIDSLDTTGAIIPTSYAGVTKFIGCDFSGSEATPIVDLVTFFSGTIEFWNCRMPASHALTGGTSSGYFSVTNYGSDDQTGLTDTNSEQQFEQHTNAGTVDVETTVVRTDGADDGATGGWSWGVVANNVTDNVVSVITPWMYVWVEGDGTAKTLTVFIANDDTEGAGNLLEDDEIYLEVVFPSAAGISMFDRVTNRLTLLGTAADIATDSSTWGTGGNNKQKLTQSISPDYQGPVYCRVHFSKSATPPVLYVDPKPEIT